MSHYDHLSSEDLLAVHERQMQQVADCVRRAESLIRQSDMRIRSSDRFLAPKASATAPSD
jgi:hypothetical protein